MECVDCGITYRKSRNTDRLRCKECYPKFLDKQRNTRYLTVYGIDLAEYNRMFAEQKGVCAACGFPETRIDRKTKKQKKLHVDHCHKTGRVRGLLCNNCNSALGLLKDDPARVAGLLAYAERQQKEADEEPKIIQKYRSKRQAEIPSVADLKIRCTQLYGSGTWLWEAIQEKLFYRAIEDEQMTSDMRLMMHNYFKAIAARDHAIEKYGNC